MKTMPSINDSENFLSKLGFTMTVFFVAYERVGHENQRAIVVFQAR